MCVSQSRFLYEGVKHFEVSVSQSEKSKCFGLAKKNASLAVSHLPFPHSDGIKIFVIHFISGNKGEHNQFLPWQVGYSTHPEENVIGPSG